MSQETDAFLRSCDVIDFDHDEVASLAGRLAGADIHETAERCFHFVRDEIKHSGDHQLNPVTCNASEVLAHGTGYCYAKSHLLCALLRANQIPTGLCYQRLSVDGVGPPYSLHGLCCLLLPEFGWYRIDPRGNRDGIDAQYNPPHESLAFAIELPEEKDLPEIHAVPLPVVVSALRRHATWDTLGRDLPDVAETA